MTTEEGNRLIAVFMGAEEIMDQIKMTSLGPAHKVHTDKMHFKDRSPDLMYVCKIIDLRYHSSWDWLMPVVIKISEYHWPEYHGKEGKREDEGDYDDCVYPRTFGMRDREGNYMVRLNASPLFSAPTLIEATWQAVVQFCEWYNQSSPITSPVTPE